MMDLVITAATANGKTGFRCQVSVFRRGLGGGGQRETRSFCFKCIPKPELGTKRMIGATKVIGFGVKFRNPPD